MSETIPPIPPPTPVDAMPPPDFAPLPVTHNVIGMPAAPLASCDMMTGEVTIDWPAIEAAVTQPPGLFLGDMARILIAARDTPTP